MSSLVKLNILTTLTVLAWGFVLGLLYVWAVLLFVL